MRKKQTFIMILLTACLVMAGCGSERQREEEEVFVKYSLAKENEF